MKNNLRFNNGKFRIMQITDTQENAMVSHDTIKLISSALDKLKPDLVVFTGDQIKGYGASFKVGNGKEKIINCLDQILKPLVDRDVPFVFTFGNHDQQGMSKEEQIKYYCSKSNCINNGKATLNVPVYSNDSKKVLFNLYVIDSGGDAKGGGYEAVTSETINWYKKTRDKLFNEVGQYVPSLTFQHIPIDEFYKVLTKVNKKTKGAIRAYRTHKNEYYVLNKDIVREGVILEPPSIPDVNTGEFEAMNEKGDVLGIFVGHDHKNSFVGKHKNIDLGFAPSAGFNVYGNGVNRGVRIFDIDESNPKSYKTYVASFKDLCGKKVKNPAMDFLYSYAPTTIEAAIPVIIKSLIGLAAIVAVIVILINLL